MGGPVRNYHEEEKLAEESVSQNMATKALSAGLFLSWCEIDMTSTDGQPTPRTVIHGGTKRG